MKSCSLCRRLFEDAAGFCPVDGQALLRVEELTAPFDSEDGRIGRSYCAGRYQIWRRVADGGMGRVYQVLDAQAGRVAAMKVLHREVAADPVSVERFRREFEVNAALSHPRIVQVTGFERLEDEGLAVVMEYLEGEELRSLLRRERVVTPERLLRLLAQAAEGLEAAHARQIIHRDLKPDNLFLCGSTEGDEVKILDFGSVRDNSAGAKKLTAVGTTIGSPFYMAPEQAQGLASLDHRADVWSLAAIAYECLTSKVPFARPTAPAILLAILTAEPEPPSRAGAAFGVSGSVDPVFERALAKNPSIRTASVTAFVKDLGHALGVSGEPADWARATEAELRAALEAHRSAPKPTPSRADPQAAVGVNSVVNPPSEDPSAFAEDVVMGLPPARPVWLWPAVVVGGLLLAIAVVLVLR